MVKQTISVHQLLCWVVSFASLLRLFNLCLLYTSLFPVTIHRRWWNKAVGRKWNRGCFFVKKVENGGCFVKKWTFPQRMVRYVQYQYFFILHFTYLGGCVRTCTCVRTPLPYGPGISVRKSLTVHYLTDLLLVKIGLLVKILCMFWFIVSVCMLLPTGE